VYHSDTEIIYPTRVTPHLRDLRGELWRNLIDRVLTSPEESIDHLAFNLLIIRMCNCIDCHTNSYRALRGCTTCAKHAVMRFRENDSGLVQCYDRAFQEVNEFIENGRVIVDGMYRPIIGDNQDG
jgi:hypothetical protein